LSNRTKHETYTPVGVQTAKGGAEKVVFKSYSFTNKGKLKEKSGL